MSYILHVWQGAPPATVRQASQKVLLSPIDPPDVGKLVPFIESLAEIYPDAYTLQERGEEPQDTVWIDSPLSRTADKGPYVLGLVTTNLDADLMQFIAHTAADHGLHVLDMQAAVVYRADRLVLSMDGGTQPLGARRAPQPRRRSAAAPLLGKNDVARLVVTRMAEYLASRDWQPHFGQDAFSTFLWRQQGEVRQLLYFSVYEDAVDEGAWQIRSEFGFSSDALGLALDEWVPEEKARRQRAIELLGPRYCDVRASRYEIFGPADEFGVENTSVPGTEQGFSDWAERYMAWYKERAAMVLHAATDLWNLGRMLHTPFYRIKFGGDAPTLFSTLLMTHLNNHPEFGQWVEVVRGANERRHGAFMEPTDRPRDDISLHFERTGIHVNLLIDRLQQVRKQPPV